MKYTADESIETHKLYSTLRNARKAAGYTQSEAALAAGYSTPQPISDLERGYTGRIPRTVYEKLQALYAKKR